MISERFEQVSGEEAASAFGGRQEEQITDRKQKQLVAQVVDAGEIHATKATYTTEIEVGWKKQSHQLVGGRNESTAHIEMKLALAEFLEKVGHQINRVENDLAPPRGPLEYSTRDYLYTGAFESQYAAGIADVGCIECATYAEVGNTPPMKLLDAALFDRTEHLYVAPYSQRNSMGRREPTEYTIYSFQSADQN